MINTKHICRAKDIETGEWIYGYYVAVPIEYGKGELTHAIFDPNECEHVCMGEYKDYGWYEVDPDTVCRCTGVPDKNGTIIYENDIVKMRSYAGGYHNTVVYFNNGKFAVNGSNHHFKNIHSNSVEIVGNKFDNGELLE